MTAQSEEDRINDTAERAAVKAIDGLFMRLGVDTSDPLEMQADFAHLRKWRQSVEQVRSVSIKTAVAVIVTGLLGALWAFFPHAAK